MVIRFAYLLFKNVLQIFIVLEFDVHLDHCFTILVLLSDKLGIGAVDMEGKYIILGFLFVRKAKEKVGIEAYFIANFTITE